MTTYEAYSTSPTSQLSFNTTNLGSIIFEFTAINVSNKFLNLPSFENIQSLGFTDVSAIATIPIEASKLSDLFYFEGYNYGNDTTVIPVMYGINTSYKFDLSYSNASLTYGAINTLANVPLKSDYVNYLAYAITGGYNTANIFSNEDVLLQGVTNMNVSFNNTINESVNSIHKNFSTLTSRVENITNTSVFFDTSDNNSLYIQGCKTLLDGLLSIASSARGDQFLTDIEAQNNSEINADSSSTSRSFYYIKFHKDDILSIVLKYIPSNGNATSIIGDNLVYTRSYKILLKCT